MSTRYSTQVPAPFSEKGSEANKPPQRGPFYRSTRQRVVVRGDSVAGAPLRSSASNIRRTINHHEAIQSEVALRPAGLKPLVVARDLMKLCAATLRPEDSIERAARLMSATDSGWVPVVDGSGRLIGIITDRDIAVKLVALGASIPHAQVSDCMSGEAFACSANSSLESCISAMLWHRLRHIPIVDDEHRILGTISRCDLACYVGEHPQRVEQGAMTDILWALAC